MTERLRALLAEATPGPYLVRRYDHGGGRVSDMETDSDLIADFYGAEDRELWIAAVNVLPALLDVVDAARRLLVGSDGDEAVDLPDEEWDPIFLDLRDALARLEDPS